MDGAGGAAASARKTVTVVFADIAGSTPLHERLDAETTRHLMDRYYAAMRSVLTDHRGTLVKLLGDGVLAAFGIPEVGEDDALRGVRAAAGMQRAFAELAGSMPLLAGEYGLRVALNTGEVVVSADDADVVGDPVNVAARLQEHASTGDVVMSDTTARLVHDSVTLSPAGEVALKGRAERVGVHRLLSLDRPVGARTTPLVGRTTEVQRLRAAFDAAATTGSTRLAMVLGSPGLGKTRLVTELARQVQGEATVVSGRCDPAGATTFAPLAEAMRDALSVDDGMPVEVVRDAVLARLPVDEPDRDQVADALAGLVTTGPVTASPESTFFAVRRVLAALARMKPVVLVLDDLHWAEPLLLDLLEHLVEWGRDAPLLVLGAARPELRDTRAALASPGGTAVEVVTLDGLDATAATQLAADLLDTRELPAAVAGRLLAVTDGNPLFLRELVWMLVEDGVLAEDGGRWTATAELTEIDMPPSIHALLAARIERLRPEQRTVIERAAVIGKQFTRAALGELVPPEFRPDLDAHLESLRRTELVESDGTWFLGDPVLRFHHALIRDAAYRRLLKSVRTDLHERYADWLRERVADQVVDHDDTLGWHLEQAHVQLVELGTDGARAAALGERASAHLTAAGRRALDRDDLAAAGTLLSRAVVCLGPDDDRAAARAGILLDLCEAHLAAGEVVLGGAAIAALRESAGDDTRFGAWSAVFRAQLIGLTEPDRLPETADSVRGAILAMQRSGDGVGEAKAQLVYASILARLGRIGEAETALDEALAAARAADSRRLANAVLTAAPVAALWGPSPVVRASGRCLDVVRVVRITWAAVPAVEAVAIRCQAVLEALRGRIDAARGMLRSAQRSLERLGLAHRLLETEVVAAYIDLVDDRPADAEPLLRHAYSELRARGLGGEAAQAAALLARACLAQGRDDEADILGREAEALAGADLKAAIAWRCVRAEVAARRGDTETACELARAAVALVETTDALLDHADARLTLATVLRAAGDERAADDEARRAAELYSAKGATVLAERAAAGAGMAPVPPATPTAAASASKAAPNAAALAYTRLADAWNRRDWASAAATLAPEWVYEEMSLRGQVGARHEGDEARARIRGLFDDIPSLEMHPELLAARGERLALHRLVARWKTSSGEPAEKDHLVITEVDESGLTVATVDLAVDLEAADLTTAFRRLDQRAAELSRDVPDYSPIPNLATRVQLELERARVAGDRSLAAELIADDFVSEDRRRSGGAHMADKQGWLDSQVFPGPTTQVDNQIVATSGDQLALIRSRITSRDPASEDEMLWVWATDAAGRLTRGVVFDTEDDVDAMRELGDMAVALAPGSEREEMLLTNAVTEALNRRDDDRLRAILAPDLIVVDHRRTGLGTIESAEAYLETVHVLFDLAPDIRMVPQDLLAVASRRFAGRAVLRGTLPDGGEFLSPLIAVFLLRDNTIARIELFEYDDTEGALARFEALRPDLSVALAPAEELRPDPTPTPNEAFRRWEDMMARLWRSSRAIDDDHWAEAEAMYTDDFVMDDRRRGARYVIDKQGALENLKLIAGADITATLLATAGEHLALLEVRFAGDEPMPFIVDTLSILELAPDGRWVALVAFDPEDEAAARTELEARFRASRTAG